MADGLTCISHTPRCYGKLQAPIPLTPLAITCATRWTRQYRNNFSRLIVPPMYRSSELLQKRARVMNPIKNLNIYRCTDYLLRLRATRIKPIDGLEPSTYRLQVDCTAIVLYRLMNMAQNRSLRHTRFIRPPLF